MTSCFIGFYLTSKKDKDKIVPGIDSTGFFKVQGIDKDNIEDAVSAGNDWFKHASVEGRYEKDARYWKFEWRNRCRL